MRETHIIQPSRRTFLKTMALTIAASAIPASVNHALAAMPGNGKTLVVYFSWPETLDPQNMSDDEKTAQ